MTLLLKTLLLPAAFVLLAAIQVPSIFILGTRLVYLLYRKRYDDFETGYDLLNNIMYLSSRLIAWWLLDSDIFGDHSDD